MSTPEPFQPTLPAEVAPTDAEIEFMESEPPGIFPQNQDSNFGFVIRKLFADRIQDLIGQQDTIYNERFVSSSIQFLDEWEIQEKVPQDTTGADVATRRTIVLNRVRKGPFTRTMRKKIVESYIEATFGTPASFSPDGIPLDSGGVPLYAGSGDVTTMYEIIEDIPGFWYHIYILNTITVSSGMARELDRITPGGIQYDINYVATLP